MEHNKEHVLGKVVLVQASEGEEDILHLHWYKRVSELCTTLTVPVKNQSDVLSPELAG